MESWQQNKTTYFHRILANQNTMFHLAEVLQQLVVLVRALEQFAEVLEQIAEVSVQAQEQLAEVLQQLAEVSVQALEQLAEVLE